MNFSKPIVTGCAALFLCAAGPEPQPQDEGASPILGVPGRSQAAADRGLLKPSTSIGGQGGLLGTRPDADQRGLLKLSLSDRSFRLKGEPMQEALASRSADTLRMLRNGTRFVSPGRWSARVEPEAVVLTAPEGGSHITIADGGVNGADEAVTAAWRIHRDGDAPTATGVQRPAREGWDETVLYRYAAAPGEARDVLALALKKGSRWTVLIHDLTISVAERRGAQLEVIFNSLLPEGYERETFAGRTANILDAARIAELKTLIETARREYDIPGVALGLIQGGEVVFEGGFGARALGRPEPVDENTLFNIASNGKALTTLMLAKLAEAERFNWDTPVVEVWPEFRLGDPEITQRVQVGQLICACTGMPRQDLEFLFEGETSTAASIMELLSTAQPTTEFGETYQYSNLMAAAAGYLGGHVLYPELELGEAYDRAMQKLVFDPLGMAATTADFTAALTDNHAAGHDRDADGRMRVADQALNLMSISTRPSGNHWSSVRDMLRYVNMELSGGLLPDGMRYIDSQLLEDRQTPQVTEGFNEFYGMGLKIDRQWGVPVIRHGGNTSGYISDMIWLPDHGVGAVILINSDAGVELRAAFRRRLLELLFDGEPLAADKMASRAPAMQAASAKEREAHTVPADSKALAGLARRYHSHELGHLTVRRQGAATLFDFGGWSSEVATSQDDAGEITFSTISPGVAGFRFTATNEAGRRRLLIADADREYVFVEQP